MTAEDNGTSIFISYAWGDGFEKKEWVRQSVVASLDWKHDVFWDRDTIALGEMITSTIRKALTKRPLLVLCLCDQDYLEAAKHEGRGLYDELLMLAEIADEPDVRVVPLILESGCSGQLPSPLAGRLYLNLQPLHSRNLHIGSAVFGVAEGCSQAQLQTEINATVAVFQLRQRALAFLNQRPMTVWGNGRTHEVTVRPEGAPGYVLTPPEWMWESDRWRYELEEDGPACCPAKGRWYWDYVQFSSEMRPLATAVMSIFFPDLTGEHGQRLLESGGILLATKFFRMNYNHEAFTFDVNDLVSALTHGDEGCRILDQLLDTAEAVTAVTYRRR